MDDASAAGTLPLKLLTFVLGARICALPLQDIREILPVAELSRPPGVPPVIEGFLNLRGAALPVVALERLFATSVRPFGPYAHLLVLERKSGPLAFLVDYVQGVLEPSCDAVQPVDAKRSINGCVVGEVVLGEQTIHLLAAERLVLNEEEARITQLQDLEQQRLRSLAEPGA